jgi:hypothetical protein
MLKDQRVMVAGRASQRETVPITGGGEPCCVRGGGRRNQQHTPAPPRCCCMTKEYTGLGSVAVATVGNGEEIIVMASARGRGVCCDLMEVLPRRHERSGGIVQGRVNLHFTRTEILLLSRVLQWLLRHEAGLGQRMLFTALCTLVPSALASIVFLLASVAAFSTLAFFATRHFSFAGKDNWNSGDASQDSSGQFYPCLRQPYRAGRNMCRSAFLGPSSATLKNTPVAPPKLCSYPPLRRKPASNTLLPWLDTSHADHAPEI